LGPWRRRRGWAWSSGGTVFDHMSEIAQPRRTRVVWDRSGGDHEASERGIIGEGEHGVARLDTAGNSPMHT